MHICIVGSSKKFFSGISAYTIVMANAFAERRHKVSVILLRNLVPLFFYPGRDRVGKGKYIVDFLPGINVYNGMDWNSPISWYGAYRFLKENKPDATILHWWTSSVAHMQLLLALAKNMNGEKNKVILEMHEVVDTLEEKIIPLRLYSRVAGKGLLKLCDAYTAHSNDARQSIIKAYNIPQDKIHVVPHGPYNAYGTDDSKDDGNELKLNGFTILHFGMIRQYKGISLLIKAFNMLPEEIAGNSNLIIVGEDWGDDAELLPALNESPYRNRIIFQPEFLPDELVPRYFNAADVVVLPYLRTCGSGVVNIAVAQGKYIITSELNTMKESLGEYKGVAYFPVGDTNTLRNRLIEAYDKWRFGEIEHYHYSDTSWQFIVQQYEKIVAAIKNQ
ncbi:MAG: glycosyltransferase [Firmicutes bacterium]|nr:glycosyltransferase [Bacillota bacterium]